jgi:Tol biopolymer transport system component
LLYLELTTFSTFQIVIRNLGTGVEKAVGRIPSGGGAAWTEDSRTILATLSTGMGTEIWAYPVEGGAPYRIYTTATNIGRLAVGTGGLLAVDADASRNNLARASAAPRGEPDVIDVANGQTWSPAFSPDGTLAFISNRSGENAIWTMRQRGKPARFFSENLGVLDRLRWSPDGKRLAFVVVKKDGVTIRVITSEGASVASFDMPSVGYGLPTWTPDGKALIVFNRLFGRAFRVDVDNPARRVPVRDKLWDGITIRSDGIFAKRADKPGIWQIDKGPRLVTANYPAAADPPLVFRGSDILIPTLDSNGLPRILSQPISGSPPTAVAYAPAAQEDSDFAIDPKTGDIIYVAGVARDTDIELLHLAKQ